MINEAARRGLVRDPIERELRVDAAASRERLVAAAAGEEFEPSVRGPHPGFDDETLCPGLVRC